ncbi:hypothetical protein [Actinokineospora globicatena]|uniref:Secreted protein n=1 Tax=Actinokineospora globicatena TaxID=103729 RepID=A0A9W6QLB2_9PSEU|nr:hypothetical protein [Actinokineospora globicatena]MCP2302389.1 hypothetical protein [Actinokineospora globicatena]GLW75937.1 hypothetical protein Aglo01_04190 [Actinokineospora globicatena]GLW82777.1 hypothetical protein Aglo02_04170 [Actinokineospora globicatena]GLW91710.1 hypothetical protein Aglo03_25260 [Actinokineospora globicatena]
MKTLTRVLGTAAATAALALIAPTADATPVRSDGESTVQYATMLVQSGAAARNAPYLNNTFLGWVTADPGSNHQVSWVDCWKDGDWATGNYSSNRWFKAYVTHTGGATQWAFVHSSYVTNQSAVRGC